MARTYVISTVRRQMRSIVCAPPDNPGREAEAKRLNKMKLCTRSDACAADIPSVSRDLRLIQHDIKHSRAPPFPDYPAAHRRWISSGPIGLEGTIRLLEEKKEELEGRFAPTFLSRIRGQGSGLWAMGAIDTEMSAYSPIFEDCPKAAPILHIIVSIPPASLCASYYYCNACASAIAA